MTSESVTIQMKATEQFFLMVLFAMLYKVVVMAQSIPNECTTLPPPPPGAFVGAFVFFKKMLQMPHGGASTFI